jgi:hypothetical protein
MIWRFVYTVLLKDPLIDFISREALFGRKLLLCYLLMSILSCYLLLFLTQRNLLDGSGMLFLNMICNRMINETSCCSRTKKKDIYVISTLKRPVPLEHYIYANKDIYKIVGANETKLNTIG